MILNLVLMIVGLIALIYGIKNKLKLWIVIGVILVVFGAASAVIDYRIGGAGGINNGRLPFVIGNMMH